MAVRGIRCIDLTKDATKLGFFSSHSKNIELEQNFNKTLIGTEKVLRMWRRRNLTLAGKVIIFNLFIQIATFVLVKGNDKFFLIQNMILMVFKLCFYKSRVSITLNFSTFLHQLVKKKLENGTAFNNTQKYDMFLKKWSILENLFPQ